MNENCYLSMIEKTHDFHRSHYIIHKGNYYFAEFDTGEQFDFFAETIGIHITERIEYREKDYQGQDNIYISSKLSISSIKDQYFYDLSQLPKGIKPIKALSNGSIVTCYYLVKDNILYWYRPNPNSKPVYKPLSIDEHIAHRKIYGLY